MEKNSSDISNREMSFIYELLGDLDTSFAPKVEGIKQADALEAERSWILDCVDAFSF